MLDPSNEHWAFLVMRLTPKWTKNPHSLQAVTKTVTADGREIKQTVGQKESWCKKNRGTLLKNQTAAEKKLFHRLPKVFKRAAIRQYPILDKGRIYFVDIYIKKYHIAIEVDGGYHNSDVQKSKDKDRDLCLSKMGIRVYRITNEQVCDDLALTHFIQMLKTIKFRGEFKGFNDKEIPYIRCAEEVAKYIRKQERSDTDNRF